MSALPRVFALTATLLSILFAPAHAEGVYFGLSGGQTALPVCDAPSVQSAVRRTIARADAGYRGGIAIETMDLIDQTGYALDTPSPVARRYCRARAYLSNGRLHPVYYMIVGPIPALSVFHGMWKPACRASTAGASMTETAGSCAAKRAPARRPRSP